MAKTRLHLTLTLSQLKTAFFITDSIFYKSRKSMWFQINLWKMNHNDKHSSDPHFFFQRGNLKNKKKVWKYGARAGLLKRGAGTFSI